MKSKNEIAFEKFLIALKKKIAENDASITNWEAAHVDEVAARQWFNAGKSVNQVMREMKLHSNA